MLEQKPNKNTIGTEGEKVTQISLNLPPKYRDFMVKYAAMTGVPIEDLVTDGMEAILEMHSSDLGRLPGDFPWRLENQ